MQFLPLAICLSLVYLLDAHNNIRMTEKVAVGWAKQVSVRTTSVKVCDPARIHHERKWMRLLLDHF